MPSNNRPPTMPPRELQPTVKPYMLDSLSNLLRQVESANAVSAQKEQAQKAHKTRHDRTQADYRALVWY